MPAAGASIQGASAIADTLAASWSITPQLTDGSGKPRPTYDRGGLGQDEGGHEQRGLRREKAARRRQQVAQQQPRAPGTEGAGGLGVVALHALGGDNRPHAARRAPIGQPTSARMPATSTNTWAAGSTSGSRRPQREHDVHRGSTMTKSESRISTSSAMRPPRRRCRRRGCR